MIDQSCFIGEKNWKKKKKVLFPGHKSIPICDKKRY